MKVWFTSDTHFSHANILKYQPNRGELFRTVQHMDEAMIARWNMLIQPEDTVYHVGDFAWGVSEACRVAERLNGRKILIPGNHDKKVINHQAFRRHWEMIAPYSYLEVTIDSQLVVLCHFPIWEWQQINRGTYHLHGHVHGKRTGIPGRILDVGSDTNDLKPYSWAEIKSFMEKQPVRLHH